MLASEKLRYESVTTHSEVFVHFRQNCVEGTDAKFSMCGDGGVMLAAMDV